MNMSKRVSNDRIPTIPENRKNFKRWKFEICSYLSMHDKANKSLLGEVEKPTKPVIEDYVVSEIVDNNRFQADRITYHTNLEKFEEKSVFIAGTIVLACHDN